jgi:hypothetical protein
VIIEPAMGDAMTLCQLLPTLTDSTDGLYVLAYGPWCCRSECELTVANEETRKRWEVRTGSLEYFLDAKTARIVYGRSRGSPVERTKTVIFYAAYRSSSAWLAF